MTLVRTVSSSTFIMSDVRSVCFPSSIQDWYREVKFWATGIRMPDVEVLDARIASALNRIIIILTSKEGSVWRNKSQKRGPFLSRKTDRLLDLRVLPGHRSQWFRRKLCRPIYNCSSKWWYSGIQFEMGWNFIINDEHPICWYLGRIVQVKKTRIWETQRPYWNCTVWRSIRRKQDLIITDWRQ